MSHQDNQGLQKIGKDSDTGGMGLPLKKLPDITSLLHRHESGDPNALEALIPLVYEHLKHIAKNQMRAQPRNHTLSPTALVHETFLKLQGNGVLNAKDRSHFFAIAAKSMRWLLTDYARSKKRQKRGGTAPERILFDEKQHSPREGGLEIAELNDLLERLEKQDPRLCRVVELHQLLGLTFEETAEALALSAGTVKRDWLLAKAWLAKAMAEKK